MQEMFGRIVGRAASPNEVTQLYRIRDALKLPDDDPFWMVLYALEYYKVLYEEIPGKIAVVVDRLEGVLAEANRALPLPVIDSAPEAPCPPPVAAMTAEDAQVLESRHAEILAAVAAMGDLTGKQLDALMKMVASGATDSANQIAELRRFMDAVTGAIEGLRRESQDSVSQIKESSLQLGKRVDAVRRLVGAVPERMVMDYKVVGIMIAAASTVSSVLTAVLLRLF